MAKKGSSGHKDKGRKPRLGPAAVSRQLAPPVDEGKHREEFTQAKREHVLSLIENGHTIVYACRTANVGHRTFYKHRKANPEFDAEVTEAYKRGVETLEEECRRRGVDGADDVQLHEGKIVYQTRPIFVPKTDKDGNACYDDEGNPLQVMIHQIITDKDGMPIPVVKKKYSDNLLMFTMKARDPERYGDKRAISNVTPLEQLNPDQVREDLIARLRGMEGKVTISQTTTTRSVTVEPKGNGKVIDGKKGNGHG
jgi:hypothetical protein